MNPLLIKLARGIGILAVILGGAGCATTTNPNPFVGSKEAVRSRVKVIAVAPLSELVGFSVTEQLRNDFEAYVTDELLRAGFRVVPASEMETIRRQESERIGGVFDPVTGKADLEKLKQVQESCNRELAAKYQVDAVLFSRLTVVKVAFNGPLAGWDGVEENCEISDLAARYFGGRRRGTVAALSFGVTLSDINNLALYKNRGGLQLLAKLSGSGQFVEVPQKDLLADPKLNQLAVKLAIRPLGP